MAGTTPARGRWEVACADHTVGPLASRQAAERRASEIAALGACPLAHEVREIG